MPGLLNSITGLYNGILTTGFYFPVDAVPTQVPNNIVSPVISGIAKVGQILSCSNGTWANSPTGYGYQWIANATSISGATSNTYVPVVGDIGKTISCTVTAINVIGGSSSTSSATSAVISASSPSTFDSNIIKFDSTANTFDAG